VRVIGIVSLCLSSIASLASAQTIAATDAAKHVGEHLTVCGSIAGEHTATSSRGTPTFINLDKPYPNQVFTVLVWGSDKASVGSLPHTGRICATGTITGYRGTPEIVLHDSHSWYIPK
jgi:micrococcal nuclease